MATIKSKLQKIAREADAIIRYYDTYAISGAVHNRRRRYTVRGLTKTNKRFEFVEEWTITESPDYIFEKFKQLVNG